MVEGHRALVSASHAKTRHAIEYTIKPIHTMNSSTIRKLWMAATGLFLCVFLVIHLLGNLQLLLPADRAKLQFNAYSRFLSHNILIKLIEWILFASIIAHIGVALLLTVAARRSNGIRYQYDRRASASKPYSRNMGLLGTIILLFLIIHLKDFWYHYKFSQLPLDDKGNTDLYSIVIAAYRQWWYVVVYAIGVLALGFHLLHGFFSAARTLGVYHPKFVQWVRIAGWAYTGLMTVGFIWIPIYVHLSTL
jgi:succinate dehydrogenase / fumarate reductase, cytochrome b subunit